MTLFESIPVKEGFSSAVLSPADFPEVVGFST
jgi:hypothetical protein